MSFPSQQFYDGRLSIGSELQAQPSLLDFWPAGSDEPIVFVHIEGVEQTSSSSAAAAAAATDERAEMSKSNVDEVLLVVSQLGFSFITHSFTHVMIVNNTSLMAASRPLLHTPTTAES